MLRWPQWRPNIYVSIHTSLDYHKTSRLPHIDYLGRCSTMMSVILVLQLCRYCCYVYVARVVPVEGAARRLPCTRGSRDTTSIPPDFPLCNTTTTVDLIHRDMTVPRPNITADRRRSSNSPLYCFLKQILCNHNFNNGCDYYMPVSTAILLPLDAMLPSTWSTVDLLAPTDIPIT